jgi:hypothetical protein
LTDFRLESLRPFVTALRCRSLCAHPVAGLLPDGLPWRSGRASPQPGSARPRSLIAHLPNNSNCRGSAASRCGHARPLRAFPKFAVHVEHPKTELVALALTRWRPLCSRASAAVHWVGAFTFSQTRTVRPSRPSIGLLLGAAVIVRIFPSSLKYRTWSVRVQASFQEMST